MRHGIDGAARPLFMLAAALALLLVTPAAFGHDGPDYILTAGETIAEAQAILLADGYLSRGAYREGVRDDATRRALKAFQYDHRLPPTGFLDWETMSELTSHEQPMVDSDGDGVPDQFDRCPDTPKGATVDANGCPKDTDGDGVFDGLDRCPDTPKGDKVDASGCSLPPPPPLAVQESLVLEGVNFETNSATLTTGSLAVLDRVAGSLAEWPEVRVEIGGHTDSTGEAAYNLDLSMRRAAAVRDYLVKKGTDGSRIEVKGHGETVPIADNATKEGRAKNRRVELKRIN